MRCGKCVIPGWGNRCRQLFEDQVVCASIVSSPERRPEATGTPTDNACLGQQIIGVHVENGFDNGETTIQLAILNRYSWAIVVVVEHVWVKLYDMVYDRLLLLLLWLFDCHRNMTARERLPYHSSSRYPSTFASIFTKSSLCMMPVPVLSTSLIFALLLRQSATSNVDTVSSVILLSTGDSCCLLIRQSFSLISILKESSWPKMNHVVVWA